MAFGLKRQELNNWKKQVTQGKISFLTHYWIDPRFPNCTTVTKVGCSDIEVLIAWGNEYNLDPKWIHHDLKYPHYDLFGELQKRILVNEGQWDQIKKFNIVE